MRKSGVPVSGAGDAVARRAGRCRFVPASRFVELQSPELGEAAPSMFGAGTRDAWLEAVLKRKRGLLAAEKIVPQREVQEAEAEVTQSRASLRLPAPH